MTPGTSCTVCANLRPETLDQVQPGQWAKLFIISTDLVRSASTKSCPECQLLSDAISIRHEDWTIDAKRWRPIRLELAHGKPAHLNYRTHESEAFNLQIYCQLSRQDLDSSVGLPITIGSAPEVPQFSDSRESISLIQKGYTDCMTGHELCRPRLTGAMPTRLLDIHGDDPVLVETSTIGKAQYVALSYCWGSPDKHAMLRTMQSTYAQHQSGIRFGSLPAALRDAIFLARTLAFRYIWIDADDWNKEAATMCTVYSQSSLTIVASRSDGSATGIFGDQFFSHHDVVFYKGTPIKVRADIRRIHETNIVSPLSLDGSPISRRAWTLQEAVLSKRAIHLTGDELRWECNTWQHCQCGQADRNFQLKRDPEDWQYEWYRLWRLEDFCPVSSAKDAYLLWQAVVAFYTKRSLTKEQDRLVALSGIAQRYSAVLEENFSVKDTYLAGIWKSALPADLLWSVEARSTSMTWGHSHYQPSTWRAPSWSWASMEAPVNHVFASQLESRLEVMEALTEPLGEDRFGQARSGMLKLRAHVLNDVQFVQDPANGEVWRYPFVKWQGLDLRIERSYFDNDLGEETDKYLSNPQQSFNLLTLAMTRAMTCICAF